MKNNTSRQKILANIRTALADAAGKSPTAPDFSAEVYLMPEEEDPAVLFATNLVATGARFCFCMDANEFVAALRDVLNQLEAGLPCVEDKYLQEILNTAHIPFQCGEQALLQARVGITTCEALVARTGSVVVSSRQAGGRRLTVFPEVHLVVAFTSQIHWHLSDALSALRKQYGMQLPSMLSFITGPSRTADIEKTLVMGAHGPMSLYVFLIENAVE